MPHKNTSIWWGAPRKFSEKLKERKISWLELFYDLVYAAVISQLTGQLAAHTTWHQLGCFFFLFALVFWSWMNGSYYHDAHGNEGVRTRYFTFLQMLAVTAVAITLKDAFAADHRPFAVAFIAVQFIITYLWWSVGYYDPSHKVLNRPYLFCYSAGLALFIASVFTGAAAAHLLWGGALVLNYGVVFISAPNLLRELARRGMTYTTSAAIVERFGLFTIIVLGETIFGIVNGIGEIAVKTPVIWCSFILGIMIAFLLWWIYFDMLGDRLIKPGYRYFIINGFSNAPLLAAFAITGSSIRVILDEPTGQPDLEARWMFASAIAAILLLIVAISAIMEQEEEAALMKRLAGMLVVTTIAVLVIAFFCLQCSNLTFLAAMMLALFIPVFIGTRLWVRQVLLKK